MRFPVKPFFQLHAYYPESTPHTMIGKLTYKNIPKSLNGSSQSMRMRYAQLANIKQTSSCVRNANGNTNGNGNNNNNNNNISNNANNMIFTYKNVPSGGISANKNTECNRVGLSI